MLKHILHRHPAVYVSVHHGKHDLVELWITIGGLFDLLSENLIVDASLLVSVILRERWLSMTNLVHETTKSPVVYTFVVDLAIYDFRGHEIWCALLCLSIGSLLGKEASDTKITNLYGAIRLTENIVTLYVSVNYVLFVQVIQSFSHAVYLVAARVLMFCLMRQVDHIREGTSFHPIKDDDNSFIVVEHFVCLHNVVTRYGLH